MTDLFRKEVFEAQRRSWLGGISIVQPVRYWVLCGFSLLAGGLVLLFLCFGDYTRRSRVAGELVPDLGLSTVIAPATGVVARLDVDEGDAVSRAEGMLVVNVPRVTSSGEDSLQALLAQQGRRIKSVSAIGSSQDRQLLAQQDGARAQRATLLRELSQIEAEIQTREEQARIGRETVTRYRSVEDQRYVSLVQINQQEQSLLEVISAQQALERQATSLRRSLAELDQRLAEIPEQRIAGNAASARDIALLDQEAVRMEADGELLLRSPIAGMVANRLVEVGQAVQPGQAVLSILPEGSHLRAQLLVPSAAVGFIKPGNRVLLRYQAYPYQKFGTHGGTVIRVSRSAMEVDRKNGGDGEALFRVMVDLDEQSVLAYGEREPLRPGMRLEADILGEERALYEWLLEPLYSVTGKIGG
ncbi:HlyD family efflux transporter periplasmic adaptor subunit [uncultured Stenotrophomonas sp.]|uniref:HlyD family secretion protein n=1 Tax=uncultured Stenotrophomonas sp. TaxID=165438 RepID=UPI0025D4E5AB|nr:HlyD family efflux transporter periplasmic adaptor subunit [uncultured Stenotrophomonas sp.]